MRCPHSLFVFCLLAVASEGLRSKSATDRYTFDTNSWNIKKLGAAATTVLKTIRLLPKPVGFRAEKKLNMSAAHELNQKGAELLHKHREHLLTWSMITDVVLVLVNGIFFNNKKEKVINNTKEMVSPESTEFCPLAITWATFTIWWILGVIVLTTRHEVDGEVDEHNQPVHRHLTAAESIMVLAQQFTSVGYGSHVPKGDDDVLQLWHGVHAWVGTALIGSDIDALVQKALDCVETMLGAPFKKNPADKLEKGIRMFLNTIILVGFLFIYSGAFTPEFQGEAEKDGGKAFLESLYVTIFTGTTTGYGDLSPVSEGGMGSSVVWMPLIVGIFSRFAALLGGDSQNADLVDWFCYDKKDEICLVAPVPNENEGQAGGEVQAIDEQREEQQDMENVQDTENVQETGNLQD